MAANPPSFTVLVFLIALVVVVAGVGAYLLFKHNTPASAYGGRTVEVGDNVTVTYIGQFGSGPEFGKVFDTSIKTVANNNATWPKSLEYSPRNASGYTPLGVHVGASTPSGGYTINGVTYGGVVTGFWKGLLGLPANKTTTISFPAKYGYGPLNLSCLRYVPLRQNLSAIVVLTSAQFAKSYPGISANAGVTFSDPTYGWTDTVSSANNSSVVVQLLPTVGATTTTAGWPVQVVAVSGGTVTIENQLTVNNAGDFLGKLAGGSICSTSQFTILSVNPNGTFTENFNREVIGQTLEFTVTVVAFAY